MLVYGDPQFRCNGATALDLLHSTLENAEPDDLDSLRTVLIRFGQLEQAFADSADADTVAALPAFHHLTDLAAELFCSSFLDRRTERSIAEIRNSLFEVSLPSQAHLTVKIPEGFEFYSLYPEQFILSAQEWSRSHKASLSKEVLVIGIRSIGTTLSAVVANTLQREGWRVDRVTVRPCGHPFNRALELSFTSGADFALIVDEGPGNSGSSMVAVAEAAVGSGISRANISFLPGHANEPGPSASEHARKWWRITPRFYTPLESLRWNGQDLRATLLDRSAQLSGKRFVTCEDLGGGRWRHLATPNDHLFSHSFASFERTKFLCIAEDGSALLWKFNGLGSFLPERPQQSDNQLARYVVAPLGNHHGFDAFPWMTGERLTRKVKSQPLIKHLAQYLLSSATKALQREEHASAIDRLTEMTFLNTKDVLGENAGKQAIIHAESAKRCNHLPGYGDGHMAPWEWIRTPAGHIVKTDWFGHDTDHTLVGRQSIAWDIAGVLVEWNFSIEETRQFITLLRESKINIEPCVLTFYRIAYSAFQMGKSELCKTMTTDHDEKRSLNNAVRYYCHSLSRSLLKETTARFFQPSY